MRNALLAALLGVSAALSSLPAGSSAAAEPTLLGDHPLADTLWRTDGGVEVSESDLAGSLPAARYLLLGEKHDNALHHALQARLLALLVEAGRRPAVVWEMLEPQHQPVMEAARLEELGQLGAALEWEARGWPSWPDYAGIAGVALLNGLPQFAGQPPRELIRGLARGEALPQEQAARLGWERDYSEAQLDPLLEQLSASHCGLLPDEALPGMAKVQRLRDAWMAAAMKEGATDDGAVLIAGAQHVREDRGVPWLLEEEALTIAFVEVRRGEEDPKAYGAFDPALFDFVWFTPRIDEDDPCERFRERMKQSGKG